MAKAYFKIEIDDLGGDQTGTRVSIQGNKDDILNGIAKGMVAMTRTKIKEPTAAQSEYLAKMMSDLAFLGISNLISADKDSVTVSMRPINEDENLTS